MSEESSKTNGGVVSQATHEQGTTESVGEVCGAVRRGCGKTRLRVHLAALHPSQHPKTVQSRLAFGFTPPDTGILSGYRHIARRRCGTQLYYRVSVAAINLLPNADQIQPLTHQTSSYLNATGGTDQIFTICANKNKPMLRALLVRFGLREPTEESPTDGFTEHEQRAEDKNESNQDKENPPDDDSNGGFIPSQLDASVLFAHGMDTAESDIEESNSHAHELERVQREVQENEAKRDPPE